MDQLFYLTPSHLRTFTPSHLRTFTLSYACLKIAVLTWNTTHTWAGCLEARLKSGEFLDVEVLKADIDTAILDNVDGSISFEDATDFDDEVGANGEIDIGEVVAQYLSLEAFWEH